MPNSIKLFEPLPSEFKYKINTSASKCGAAKYWLLINGYENKKDFIIMLGLFYTNFYFKSIELAVEFELVNL